MTDEDETTPVERVDRVQPAEREFLRRIAKYQSEIVLQNVEILKILREQHKAGVSPAVLRAMQAAGYGVVALLGAAFLFGAYEAIAWVLQRLR